MAKRKSRFEPVAVAETDPKTKTRYQDPFQQKLGKTVEDAGKKLEGHGKTILYFIGTLVVLAITIGIFYAWNSRSNATAQAALGRAIEISQRAVSDQPPEPGSTQKTFKTEKERAEASIVEFQAVADKFGGDVGEKAKYFVAVNRLSLDKPAAITELEALATSSGEVGKLSKFALAQAKADDGKPDEAAALYQELAAMSDPIISKETINFELANIYEKQGKNKEAADLYFNIAKAASEAKDLDGKPVTTTETARAAKEKLEVLDPERAKEIPDPSALPPPGGLPPELQ